MRSEHSQGRYPRIEASAYLTTGKPSQVGTAWLVICLIAVVAILRLWLDLQLPVRFLYYAGHDDGLFMRQAEHLLSLRWLGPYDRLTLAKGPGYGFFVAASNLSGLPITLTQSIFQLLAIAIAAFTVWRITGSAFLAVASFTILALHPIAFIGASRAIVREQIYWPQSLLVISLLALMTFERKRRLQLFTAVAAGSVFGWAWVTREEGIAFLPPVGMLLLAALIHAFFGGWLYQWLRNVAVFAGSFAFVVLTTMSVNLVIYGVFVTVDFKDRNFQRAIAALQSVDIGKRPHLAVSAEAREEIAAVSPTFAPLAERLRPGQPLVKTWGKATCRLYPSLCGDLATGWFIWALRDAASQEGYYQDARATSDMFGRLADEVEQACWDGHFPCKRGLGMMPPMLEGQWLDLVHAVYRSAARTAFNVRPHVDPPAPRNVIDKPQALHRLALLNFPRITGSSRFAGQVICERVRAVLVSAYLVGVPILVLMGSLAAVLTAALAIYRRVLSQALVLAFAAWAFVGGRIAIMAAVDISSFPGANYRYASPGSYVAVLASLLSLFCLATLARYGGDEVEAPIKNRS